MLRLVGRPLRLKLGARIMPDPERWLGQQLFGEANQ